MSQLPSVLTPKEVAAALRVHIQVVYELIRSHRLPASNVSRSGSSGSRPIWRIQASAVAEFLDRNGLSAQPAPSRPSLARRRQPCPPPPSIVGPRSRRGR